MTNHFLALFGIFSFITQPICLAQSTLTPPWFSWWEKEVDKIDIGYGLQIADVNGDGELDIILADKRTIQWYEAPNWDKHIIAKHLALRDNVCVTARDIDGDGKCEIAVGSNWNFNETLKDGAVFYLQPGEDPTQPWDPIQLYNDPNTHRMHWIKGTGDWYSLLVKPLRGRGSIDGVGPGLRLMEYFNPVDPKKGEWRIDIINEDLHLSHNFHPINWDQDPEEEVLIAAKEGVWCLDRDEDQKWTSKQIITDFTGEIRDGKLPNGKRFIATIEPMHGTRSAVYVEPDEPTADGIWQQRAILGDDLIDGHALAIADFLGTGSDQIVVGWRAMKPKGEPGIRLYTPLDPEGKQWRMQSISKEKIAVEDIKAADLNGDGRADIIAAGRQTKNLMIFYSSVK